MEMSRFRYLLVGALILHLLSMFFDVGVNSHYNMAIAPELIGTLAAAGGSVLGNLINKSNAEYSLKQQKSLMNYEWNNFTSPKAQAASLAEAGLNPAVAFGNGSIHSVSPSSNAPQVAQVQQSGTDMANVLLAAAQANKAGLEAEGQKLLNDYNSKTMAERVRAVGLQNNWTEENTTKVIQDWNKTVGEINILQKEAAIKDIDLEKHEELVNSLINSYAAKANFDKEQTNQLRQQLPLILSKLKSEDAILSVDANIANTYKETMSTLGVVGQGIKILQTLLKILK